MEIENDILHEFSEDIQVLKKNALGVIVILFSINILLSTLLFYSSLKAANITLSVLTSSKIFFFTILVQRLFPLLIIFLLLLKTRLGWILGSIMTVIDLLSKGLFAIRGLNDSQLFLNVTHGMLVHYFFTFATSAFIMYLLFSDSMNAFFKVGKTTKWITVIIAIILFLLSQYLTSYLMKTGRPHFK